MPATVRSVWLKAGSPNGRYTWVNTHANAQNPSIDSRLADNTHLEAHFRVLIVAMLDVAYFAAHKAIP